MRRQQLTETQAAALFDPPTEPRELIRHYTLSAGDLAIVRRCRGDHNRLGCALMLCYLRYPGRPLRAGERSPAELTAFVAEQIDAPPTAIEAYLAAERNRQRHAVECQERLRLRPFGKHAAAELADALHPHALENDRLFHLAELVMEECRRRRIVVPGPRRLERLCIDLRFRARREIERRLTDGLSPEQRRQLDALTQRRAQTGQSWLGWLRQMPQATKPAAMLGLIERLNHVRAIGIDAARGHRVHQARLAQLAREAGRTTAQHIAGYERQRRHATLVAITLELGTALTDQAIDLFERLVGTMFSKAETRHARAFQADGRAINEKVRLYARVGTALIAAREGGQDPYEAITTVVPRERFRASVAEAEALARPEDFDSYERLSGHYAAMHRWAPAFFSAFSFQGGPAAASLLHAVDVWVAGSRRYRSFEEHLISREALQEMLQADNLPVAVDPDFERFIASRRALLDARMAAVDAKAKGGLLLDVSLEKGVLKIAPIEKSTPPEAEVLAARLYAMLPRIRITDLLSEVARWTLFTDCFTHLRSGETVADPRILMAGLLADGLNLGLTRMADACTIASLGQLAWVADWHIRDETYALALRRLVDHQQREPLAAIFGDGFASSSDGQFFRAGGYGRDAGRLNAHYGDAPGSKFYTHVSDRFAPFFTKVIAATASEALHILDGLLYHQSDVTVRRHHTDGGGDSEHVFALLALLGFQFAPRIPDLKHRRLYSFAKPSAYPTLEPLIAGRLNVALIRAHWPEILRVAASIRTGSVTASLIMRQLAAYPRQNGVAAALRELGRLERTLFTLDWIEDPELRRDTGRELNKGESRNSLARAVFIHRLGEIRDRTYENQQHRASGLNLLVAAITLWNTRYLNRAITALRKTEAVPVPDQLLAHLSPLGWEHINLTGDYVWAVADEATENRDGFRPLRPAPDPALLAA
jgi:TnpA family transposase